MRGPMLETLLQQEALCQAAFDAGQSTSIICLRSQKPYLRTRTPQNVINSGMSQTQTVVERQQPAATCQGWTPYPVQPDWSWRGEHDDSWDEHLKITQRTETDGSRSTGLSFEPSTMFRTASSSCFHLTSIDNLTDVVCMSGTERMDRGDTCPETEISSRKGCRDAFHSDPEREQLGIQDWNAYKFRKRNGDRSDGQSNGCYHPDGREDEIREAQYNERMTPLESSWDRVSDMDWNWNFDVLLDDDDAVFDSNFSTGLDSMTEISGLEESTTHAGITGFNRDTFSSFPELGHYESCAEMAHGNDASHSRTSSCHLTERASRAEQPSAKNNKRASPLSRNGLFPDYKRLKRTSEVSVVPAYINDHGPFLAETTKKSRQSRWIYES